MHKTRLRNPSILTVQLVTVAAIVWATGCDTRDQRLAEFAEQSTEQQARQNEQMARHTQEIAEANRELIAADALARQEIIAAQQQLQEQQAQVGEQRDALEADRREAGRERSQLDAERRQIAAQRHRDPIIAAAVSSLGLLLACLLPLVLAWLIVRNLRADSTDEALGELLVMEMTADESLLLPPPPAAPPAIGGPAEGEAHAT